MGSGILGAGELSGGRLKPAWELSSAHTGGRFLAMVVRVNSGENPVFYWKK
jgi:hypothetical protein